MESMSHPSTLFQFVASLSDSPLTFADSSLTDAFFLSVPATPDCM